ncbi:MAG TPA: hypothetical protein VFS66_06560 [Acidimicrobiia bacterium]|nr:hypothetical protein [Acidimicrobiia bacterium]
MSQHPDRTYGLMGVFVETARAHHAETGGSNSEWAKWYAGRALDEVNRILGAEMTADDLAAWLAAADRRYTQESPDQSWPRAYATWLLEEPR